MTLKTRIRNNPHSKSVRNRIKKTKKQTQFPGLTPRCDGKLGNCVCFYILNVRQCGTIRNYAGLFEIIGDGTCL